MLYYSNNQSVHILLKKKKYKNITPGDKLPDTRVGLIKIHKPFRENKQFDSTGNGTATGICICVSASVYLHLLLPDTRSSFIFIRFHCVSIVAFSFGFGVGFGFGVLIRF